MFYLCIIVLFTKLEKAQMLDMRNKIHEMFIKQSINKINPKIYLRDSKKVSYLVGMLINK